MKKKEPKYYIIKVEREREEGGGTLIASIRVTLNRFKAMGKEGFFEEIKKIIDRLENIEKDKK